MHTGGIYLPFSTHFWLIKGPRHDCDARTPRPRGFLSAYAMHNGKTALRHNHFQVLNHSLYPMDTSASATPAARLGTCAKLAQ